MATKYVPPALRRKQGQQQPPLSAIEETPASHEVMDVVVSKTTSAKKRPREVNLAEDGETLAPTPATFAASRRSSQATKKKGTDEAMKRYSNRLTTTNFLEIAASISDLFLTAGESRAAVIDSLTRTVATEANAPDLSVAPIVSIAYAALIRGLQVQHGNDVAAPLIASVCELLLQHVHQSKDQGASNCVALLGNLFLFHAVDSQLILSLLRGFLKSTHNPGVDDCQAHACLTLLRTCGQRLRADSPSEFQQIVLAAQAVASQNVQSSSSQRFHVLVSLCKEIAIGKTKSAKRTHHEGGVAATKEEAAVEECLDKLTDFLSTQTGGGGSGAREKQILARARRRLLATRNVLQGYSFQFLAREDKPDRWWTTSAVEEDHDDEESSSAEHDDDYDEEEDETLHPVKKDAKASKAVSDEDLKRQRIERIRTEEKAIAGQRLTTEAKRQIFQCVTSSTDDLEAFHMLMHRDHANTQAPEVAAIILQCCVQESLYNSYYASLLLRLCASQKKKFSTVLQFAIWDRIKTMRMESTVDLPGYVNLAVLLSTLVEESAFQLTVLRGLDLDQTHKNVALFAKLFFLRLLQSCSPARLMSLFFGGDGFSAHDVNVDTSHFRKCIQMFWRKYFVDEDEAGKWMPLFYGLMADAGGLRQSGKAESEESVVKRIRVVYRALRGGTL